MATNPGGEKGETLLECIVCNSFTGGSVLCSECMAKAEFRQIGKACERARPGTGELVTLLMEMAYEIGKDHAKPRES
jgi:hypothetical protein